jgi:transposase
MPKQYPKEQRDRAVRIGSESLRRWTQQAQVDAGTRDGPTSEELAEIKALN